MNKETVIDSKLFLSRDFSSIMEWSIGTIPKITSDWTDFTITDPGIILMSATSYLYDSLNYILDKQFINNQIRFSKSYNSITSMCDLMGVEVPFYNTSTTILEIVYNTNGLTSGSKIYLTKDVHIFMVYDKFTNKTIYLNLLQDEVIEEGTNYISCYEGFVKNLTLPKNNISSIGTYIIDAPNIASNSFVIKDGVVTWVKCKDALLSTKGEKTYSIHRYENNTTLIKFTPGFKTLINQTELDISYLVTRGVEGNVSLTSEITPYNKMFNEFDEAVFKNITIKPTVSLGGQDSASIDLMRSILGRTVREVNTLVTDEDYSKLSSEVDYVLDIVAQDVNGIKRIYYVPYKNYIDLGINLSDLEDAIDEVVIDRVPAFTEYAIQKIEERPLSIELEVFLNRNLLNTQKLQDTIENYILDKFDWENQNPGFEFYRNELATGIEKLDDSISHVIIDYPSSDIICKWNEIIDFVDVTISFGRKG
jgi:hypothetical protein